MSCPVRASSTSLASGTPNRAPWMLYFMESPIYKWMITGGRPYRKAPFEYSTWGCSCNHHWIHIYILYIYIYNIYIYIIYIYKIVIRALSQLMRVNTIVIPEKISQSCTPKQEQIRSSQFLFGDIFRLRIKQQQVIIFFQFAGRLPGNLVRPETSVLGPNISLLFCRTLLHPNGEKTHVFSEQILKNSLFHR